MKGIRPSVVLLTHKNIDLYVVFKEVSLGPNHLFH
jgi:hypothetical protein